MFLFIHYIKQLDFLSAQKRALSQAFRLTRQMMQVFVRIAVISMSGLPACELSAEHRVILIVLPTARSYPAVAVAVPEEKYALPTMLVDTPLLERTSVFCTRIDRTTLLDPYHRVAIS